MISQKNILVWESKLDSVLLDLQVSNIRVAHGATERI